jgi:uncharacterized coiled-coil DUF342 family protein
MEGDLARSAETADNQRRWQLLKDVNAARYNKAALEMAIAEHQQLIDFVHSLTEKVSEAAHSHRGVYDLRMALELINAEVAPIAQRIDLLQTSSEFLSIADVADAQRMLPVDMVPLTVDAQGTSLSDLTTAELEERVKEARRACASWLAERDRVAANQRRLRESAAQLAAKRNAWKNLASLVQTRDNLQHEVDWLQSRCETLSKLLQLRR